MNGIFYISIVISFFIDYFFWRKITPYMISFVGVFVISLLYDLFGKALGFIDLEPEVYLYFSIFSFTGLMASLLGGYLSSKITLKHKYPIATYRELLSYSDKGIRYFFVYVLVLGILCLYGVYNAYTISGSWTGEEFEALLSQGVFGHSYALLMASTPFIYLMASQKNSKKTYVLLFFVLFLLFMKQIKYWVIVPLIWMFLLSIYINRSNMVELLKRAFFISTLIFIFFASAYSLVIIINSGDADIVLMIKDIFGHFLGYIFSGILVFSSLIKDGYFNNLVPHDPFIAFQGGVNLVSVLIGQGLYQGSEILIPFYSLNPLTGKTGNVGTLWASFLLYLGSYSFFIFFIIILMLSLLLKLSKHYAGAFIVYTCLSSFMFLTWFSSYFSLLSPYETPVLAFIIYVILSRFRLKVINPIS